MDNIPEKVVGLAWRAIRHYLEHGDKYIPDAKEYTEELFLKENGVFVTLKKFNKLRGCIGNIEGNDKVYLSIADNAVAAAFYDPRFPPVLADELGEIELEVSILTKPRRFNYENLDELIAFLEKDKPGVIVEHDGLTATYLPSVWEELPKVADFLTSLCLKAGLPQDIWQTEKITIRTYKAIIY